MLLDLGGMIPGLGAGADLLNAAVSAFRGDFWGAGLSLFSAIPLLGDAAGLAKIAKNGEKYLNALKVVEQKLLPKLPASLRKKVEDYLAKIKTKLDELLGKKPEPPKKQPEPPPKKSDGGSDKGNGKKGDGPNCPICPTKASPINPVIGAKVLAGDIDFDFELPGLLPLTWQRYYASNNPYIGWLGQGWGTPLEVILEMASDGGVNFVDEFGRVVEFPSIAKGQEFHSRSEQTTLRRDARGSYSLVMPDGVTLQFQAKHQRNRLLSSITDRNGNSVRIERAKGESLPSFIHANGGQLLELEWTETERLACVYELRGVLPSVKLPQGKSATKKTTDVSTDTWDRIEHSPNIERIAHVTYLYDTLGDLRQVFNRVGEIAREFGWHDHLMIAHRTSGELEAFYEYEGQAELKTTGRQLDPSCRVIRHWSNTGETLALTYEKNQTITIDQMGRREIYHFIISDKGHRRWTGTTHAEGMRSQRTLDIHGNVLSVSDPVGNSTGYAYNRRSQPISITDPSGAITRLQWSEEPGQESLISAITDPLQRTTRFAYDARSNLSEQTEPDGASTRYEYDERGIPCAITDALGGRKTLVHNGAGQLIRYTDCSQRTTEFEYNRDGQLARVVDAEGNETAYTYDAIGRLLSEQRPDGSTETYRYDSAGRLIEHIDANGAATAYELAPDGLPLVRTNALGASLRYEYDPARRLAALINENGARYSFQYNRLDQLVQETGFDNKTTTYDYDQAGYLTEQTEAPETPDAVTTRYQRDLMGRLLSKTTGLLPAKPTSHTRFQYDAAGQLIAAYTEDTATRLDYDRAGRLARERLTIYIPDTDTPLADTTLDHRYDALGNRITTLLPTQAQQPKAWHELLAGEAWDDNPGPSAADIIAKQSQFTKGLHHLYYGSGHLHQINFDGHSISDIERDALHREISRSQGLLHSQYALDPLGRLTAQQVSRSLGSSQLQPALARLLSSQLPTANVRKPSQGAARNQGTGKPQQPLLDGSLIERQYGYDNAGNLRAQQDWSRPVAYSYDALGRVLSAQAYTSAKRSQLLRQEQFAFDPAHNLIDTNPVNTANTANASPLDPDETVLGVGARKAPANPAASQATSASTGLVLDNRVLVHEDKRYQYDSQGRLTDKRVGRHTHIQLRWDDEHQLMQSTRHRTGQASQSTRYLYDAFGRRVAKIPMPGSGQLASEPSQVKASLYLWDGNRLLQQRIPAAATSAKNSAQSAAKSYLCTTFLYEPDSFIPLAQLHWHEGEQGIQESNYGMQSVPAINDAQRLGEQVQVNSGVGTGTRTGTYGGSHGGASAYAGSGAGAGGSNSQDLITAYQQSLPVPLQALNAQGIGVRYYHCDQIGLPRELTDEAGSIVWRASFKTWGGVESQFSAAGGLKLAASLGQLTQLGEHLADEHQSSSLEHLQPLRFQGQYHDAETGLHYNRFRYYDSDVGRFVSEDPIGLEGGLNLHRLAPNLTSWIDPLGLSRKCPTRQGVLAATAGLLKTAEPAIKVLDPTARVGIRGSAATGVSSRGKSWSNSSDIDAYVASDKMFNNPAGRYGNQIPGLGAIEDSIDAALRVIFPCLGKTGEKLFSFKAQRQNFPENAARFKEIIFPIF